MAKSPSKSRKRIAARSRTNVVPTKKFIEKIKAAVKSNLEGERAPTDGSIVVFADLVRSSETAGDFKAEWYLEVSHMHNEAVVEAFRSFGGQLIKEIGDEVMIRIAKGKRRNLKPSVAAILGAVKAQLALLRLRNDMGYQGEKLLHSKIAIASATDAREYTPPWRSALSKVKDASRELNKHLAKDLLGDSINRAARIAGITKGDQIVVDHEVVQSLNNGERKKLKKQNIDFSPPRTYRTLKNIGNPVDVVEVIHGEQASGIGLKDVQIQALVRLDTPQDIDPMMVLQRLRDQVFSEQREKYPGRLIYACRLLSGQSLVLRVQSTDFDEHRQVMTEILSVCSKVSARAQPTMAHSLFRYGKGSDVDRTLRDNLVEQCYLLIFGLNATDPSQMEQFAGNLEKKLGSEKIICIDWGLLFGEHEAYFLIGRTIVDGGKTSSTEADSDGPPTNSEAEASETSPRQPLSPASSNSASSKLLKDVAVVLEDRPWSMTDPVLDIRSLEILPLVSLSDQQGTERLRVEATEQSTACESQPPRTAQAPSVR